MREHALVTGGVTVNYLPFIIAGLVAGSVYGLAATGLVLVYRTAGVFNFGHGAIAALAAYVFFFLHVQHHVAWPLAAFISICVFGPVIGLVLEALTRNLPFVNPAYQVVATVGIIVLVVAICVQWYGV